MPANMKAMIWTAYGPPEVFQLQEVAIPVPKDNEVLIHIFTTTVTAGDCEARAFTFPALFWLPLRLYMGILKPRLKILGQEFAGVIAAVGKDVTRFKTGDEVFGPVDMNFGTYAEYMTMSSDFAIAHKPANITFGEAATAPMGGLNALYFIQKANIKPGQHILINGAGGCIGTYAIQLAKAAGAEITAVDSASKGEMLQSIGADHVIDYKTEDFTGNGIQYDVIFDIIGKTSFSRIVKSLKLDGMLLIANPRLHLMLRGFWISKTSDKTIINGVAKYEIEEIEHVRKLLEAGTLKSVIDRRYPLEQLVEAHRYVETGEKKGHLVIDVMGEG